MAQIEYSDGRVSFEPRDKMQSIIRGAHKKCPNCGEGSVFASFLKVAENCENCSEELHHERSDDAAPYFTIFILGHIIVPLLFILETRILPPYWVYAVIGIPLVVALTLMILPRVKGAVVGLQWALFMHGFDPGDRSQSASQNGEAL